MPCVDSRSKNSSLNSKLPRICSFRQRRPHHQDFLTQLSKVQFSDPHQLIRFHECLLFHPFFLTGARSILASRICSTLFTGVWKRFTPTALTFPSSMTSILPALPAPPCRTRFRSTLSNGCRGRFPRNVDIAWDDYWDDYQAERARGSIWPRFIPLLEEDADVEANIPWQRWLEAARGRENPLPWLIRRFERLALPARQRAELYDSLHLPIRWCLENLKLSRTRNFARPRHFYFHDAPLIQRSEVSLARELARPAPEVRNTFSRTRRSRDARDPRSHARSLP